MDHTYATPFFAPYYDERNRFTICGTRTVLDSLQAVLSPESALSKTYFPPTFAMMKALDHFQEIDPGEELCVGDCHHHPVPVPPRRLPGLPAGARRQRFVFATDHEQTEVPDAALTELARGAELLYTEGQYTQAEYEGREALPSERRWHGTAGATVLLRRVCGRRWPRVCAGCTSATATRCAATRTLPDWRRWRRRWLATNCTAAAATPRRWKSRSLTRGSPSASAVPPVAAFARMRGTAARILAKAATGRSFPAV